MTRANRYGWVALSLLLCGCTEYAQPIDADDLEVVSDEDAPLVEAPEPNRILLLVEPEPARETRGPVDLWLALPLSGAAQTVQTLVWEVIPPATSLGVETQKSGERLLHLRSREGFPHVTLRCLVERAPELPPLPPKVLQKGAVDAASWQEEARARGFEVRMATAIQPAGSGGAVRDVPEVLSGGAWIPVDVGTGKAGLPPDSVRLSVGATRATAGGEPLEVRQRFRFPEQQR